MLNRIFKITINRKCLRRSVRKFVRTRYQSVNKNDPTVIIAQQILMAFFRNFDAQKKNFDTISIQTQTGCNYSCFSCPANKSGLNLYGGAASGAKMELSIFKKIIDQLADLKFRGRISPDAMNEPLLDDRLPELVSIIKRKCPKAFIFIQTNGSLLDKKLAIGLIKAGVDELYVNDYTVGNLILKRLNTMGLDNKYQRQITLENRSFRERLSNRAGNVYLGSSFNQPLKFTCIKPFRQMFITYDGKAILCCQDWKFIQLLGDTKKEMLLDIWRNEIYKKIRSDLKNGIRANNPLCSKCDFSGLW